MTWYPHVTVATVIEKDNRYLMVKEHAENNLVYNQPAGHLDPNESLENAACRETLEETGWDICLTGFLGVSVYKSPANNITYVRNTFVAKPLHHHRDQALDDGIVDALWLTYEEILQREHELRSPIVLKAIQDHRAGKHYPLDLVHQHR